MLSLRARSMPVVNGAVLLTTTGMPALYAFATMPAGILPVQTKKQSFSFRPFMNAFPTALSMVLCRPMSSAYETQVARGVIYDRTVCAARALPQPCEIVDLVEPCKDLVHVQALCLTL